MTTATIRRKQRQRTNRTCVIGVRLQPSEEAAIRKLCGDVTVSTFVRRLILKELAKGK